MARAGLVAALTQLAAAPEVRASTGAWSRAARWARVAGLILLVLMLATAAYLLVFSRGVVEDAHRRNYSDLAVAANGLETWPATIRRLALTNFAPGRLKPALVGELTEGWSDVATLDHPDLGPLRLRYAVRKLDKTPCPSGEIDPATDKPLAGPAFVQSGRPGAGPGFVVAGHLRIDDIWAADMDDGAELAGTPATRARAVLAAARARAITTAIPDSAAARSSFVLCFRAAVPLDRLVALERTGKGFAHLLVTDGAGTIYGQTGGDLLPVRKLPDLRRSTLGRLDLGETAPAAASLSLDAVHRPAEVEIGNESYTVYARAFTLPGLPTPCAPPALPAPATEKPAAARTPDAAAAAAAAADKPVAAVPPATCYAVALMPAGSLRARWSAPPPLIVFGFAIVVLAALAIFPALRLILIGGTEAVHGLEITAVVAGLQMAASLAMLAFLATIQVSAERRAAQDRGRALATAIADATGAEVATVISEIDRVTAPGALIRRQLLPPGPPCPRPATSAYPAIAPEVTRLTPNPVQVLPIVESIILVGRNGRQVPGSRLLVDRNDAAVRIDVGSRDYFLDLQRGVRLAPPPPKAPPLRYTIDVVRAQTDGINKTVLAIDAAALPPKPAATGPARDCPLGGALIVPTVLRSFLAPVLPSPHRFLVIDRLQLDFPVLFHSDPERAGVEHFAPLLRDSPEVRRRLAGLAPGAGSAPLGFALRYDGRQQRFAARPVPGTNWAVVVFHADDDIDALAARAGRQTLYLWVAFGSLGVVGLYIAIRSGSAEKPWYGAPAEVSVRAGHAQARWRRFWPHEAAGREYARLIPLLLGSALVLLILVGLTALAGAPGAGVALVLLTVAGLLFWVGHRLGNIRPGDDPLSPLSQRDFGRFVAALLFCTAALPTLAFWLDALALVSADRTALVWQAGLDAIETRNRRTTAIQQLFDGTASPRPRPDVHEGRGVFPPLPAVVAKPDNKNPKAANPDLPTRQPRPTLVTDVLRSIQQGLPPAPAPVCTGKMPGALCGTPDLGIVPRDLLAILRAGLDGSGAMFARLTALCLLAGGLILALVKLGRLIFRALFGFGIPLAAVTLPKLWIDKPDTAAPDPDYQTFGSKALLVAPQQATREMTLDPARAQIVDLVDATAALVASDTAAPATITWAPGKRRLAVTGLDLILRDPARRRAALGILEALAAKADAAHARAENLAAKALAAEVAANRAANTAALAAEDAALADAAECIGSPTAPALRAAADISRALADTAAAAPLNRVGAVTWRRAAARARRELVVITDRAPLDRILDAFEIEKQRTGADNAEVAATRKVREELRWARLFQDFATFTFAPVNKIDDAAATDRLVIRHHFRDWPKAMQKGAATLVDEMRWLPGAVINSSTFRPTRLDATAVASGRFPLPPKRYREVFTTPVADWAATVRPSSPEAAIEYVWSTVIEYYQQAWSSSTHGERLALDAIASGRFVNFASALAMKSLVRRGLVVLDPAPRLMNASFASFVRQAERPETLAQWRTEQPGGGWTAARLPIIIGLAAMVIVLGVVVDASQSLGTLVPLIFAGAPALATTLATLLKRN